ncbi:13857_t:CDS:2 [Acaulospora morrowiae]|uniref:13857_t:CDS:1 n=1 Tax=Acaulospora morrowiae TaxID=94023 RepID=A0A9N9BFH5_9GLOM|nr:13857_t:CDS:2 [Acaulospora morrowiae]
MNPETSTLQPPPYEAIDEAQNISLRLAHANFPEMNQSHVVSSHKVANSGNNLTPNLLNMFLSQNESDVSMHDVDPGSSQAEILSFNPLSLRFCDRQKKYLITTNNQLRHVSEN